MKGPSGGSNLDLERSVSWTCGVRSSQDIASGLFLTTLILQFEELSKRFVPEAVNF